MEVEYLRNHHMLLIVIDHVVAEAHFDGFVNLLVHTCQYFIAGYVVAFHDAVYAQWLGGENGDYLIEVVKGFCFKEESGLFQYVGGVLLLGPVVGIPYGGRVYEGVEESELVFVVENDISEEFAV